MAEQEFKDSKIEWIGVIPNCWQLHPIYSYFTERKCLNKIGKEQNLLSLSYGQIVKKDINTCEGLLPASFNTYNIINPGDIVFRLTDLQNDKRSLRTGLSRERGIITSAYVTISPKTEIDTRFYHYLFHAYDINKVFYNLGNGVRQGSNYSELSRLMVLEPPKNEQIAIANFLDSKCAEIDALKADIEKQIETLQEYKKSVITEAVTKGLDPNVEMKMSGCNWIGQIPKAWTESKVKLHLKRRTVRNPSPGNTEILSLYREYGVIPKNSRDDNHNVTSADTSKYLFVRRGDFVINKMKAWQGSVALSSYEGVVSPAYFVYEFISDQLDKQYLHYLLRSCYKDEFRRLSAGIREGQWDLSPESFSNLLLILPSLEEQIEISQYLETTLPQIDKLIRDKGNQLETLAQYKQSLIYEYVTGKKAVPANF